MHILSHCTSYFILLFVPFFILTYIYIYILLCYVSLFYCLCYFYFIFYYYYILFFLHFPSSGPVLTYISLLIIPCMIVYVTNNKEPWTLNCFVISENHYFLRCISLPTITLDQLSGWFNTFPSKTFFTPEPYYVDLTEEPSSISFQSVLLEDQSLVWLYFPTQQDNQQSPSLIAAFVLFCIGACDALQNVSAAFETWSMREKRGDCRVRPRWRLKAEANSYWSERRTKKTLGRGWRKASLSSTATMRPNDISNDCALQSPSSESREHDCRGNSSKVYVIHLNFNWFVFI